MSNFWKSRQMPYKFINMLYRLLFLGENPVSVFKPMGITGLHLSNKRITEKFNFQWNITADGLFVVHTADRWRFHL